jgi:hypothetical protein
MKKHIKLISLVLCVVLLLCCIPILAESNVKSLTVGNTSISTGNVGRITITARNFKGFVGGFNFEIKFPEIVQITNVYLGKNKLISLSNGGADYTVNSENTLILTDTCNYGDDTAFGDNTAYYVEFVLDDDAKNGEYPVVVTKDSCIVADYNDMALMSLNTHDGTITVINSDFLKADIDENGKNDGEDLIVLRKRLLGMDFDGAFNEIAADVNADGKVNILDLVAINEYLSRTVVYLSDNGDDSNVGDIENAPVATLDRAIQQVCDGGIVCITDTYTVDDSFYWNKHLKSVEITGGNLEATAVSAFKIADNITLTDIILNFKDGADIYANGFYLKIGDDVIVNGKTNLYGGGTTAVENTSLEIYSGSYRQIYGGGNGADVNYNANIIIGGNVNSDLDETDHDAEIYIYGGSNNGTVGGNTNLTIKDNAKFTYIFGAGNGTNSNVLGKTDVKIYDGAFMSAYAGSSNGKCSNAELTLFGGTIEQIFGGCSGTSMTGNAKLNILGGTVTRRIYGGCYNGTSGISFSTQNHVIGNTTVFLSSKANITLDWVGTDGSSSDRAIFACSRYKTHFDDENSTIIYEDSAAQTKFSGKLGQKATDLGTLLISWPKDAAKKITIQN